MTTRDWLEAAALFLLALGFFWWRGRRSYNPLDHTPGMDPHALRQRDVEKDKTS